MKPRTIQDEAAELAALEPSLADLGEMRLAVTSTLRRLCDDPSSVLLPDIDPGTAKRRLRGALSVLEATIAQYRVQP